ncbi:16S rRNA (uracil(1498)-N(3))-methyltransferase [Hamadaea tsunoensis]|uniref:16S rRNA (uracil(1498)-N(3))-methyltransferase n=1 Tax=Hamadaea tsunoensis TaxID=53368 RepID=UPI0003FB72E3|nr:16S rRNA (uracil(1498)-N(3))-methyltransferase [Hamadaea tsunoensis]
MSRPLFLVDALPGVGPFVLDGPEGHHAADVQRVRPGSELLLSDGAGGVATATVAGAGKGRLDLAVTTSARLDPPSPRLVVAQGIAKGDRGELAVQAMTEAGVDEILPWAASRSVVQWRAERGHKSREKWAATAREAAKQARRPFVPAVGGDPDVSTRALCARAAGAFVLHEEADVRLSQATLPAAGDLLLVIGPEGGISDEELAALVAAGALPVRLGEEVLRTSTAGVAAISVLNVRLGRW